MSEETKKTVRRWEPYAYIGEATMREVDGVIRLGPGYVASEDYDALAAENAALRAECDAMAKGLEEISAKLPTLCEIKNKQARIIGQLALQAIAREALAARGRA